MNLARLVSALIAVESSGDDFARGDHGQALGPLQIHRAYVADVNERCGTNFRWERMTNRTEAVAVFTRYVRIYAPKGATAEQIARIHNGGPDGHRQPETVAYWRKVRRHLNRTKTATKK